MTEFSLFLLVFTVSRWLAESGASLLEMGIVGGLFSLTSSVSSVVGGRLADRIGNRPVILGGMALAVAGELTVLSAAPGTVVYLVGYFLVGSGVGGMYPPILAELTRGGGDVIVNRSGVGRTIILFCVAWNLGLIASQLLGGALFESSPEYPLLVAVASTLGSAGAIRTLGRRPVATEAAPELTDAHHEHTALSAAYVRLAWLANLAGTFAMSMIFHLFPKLMVTMGIDPERHGMLLAFSRVVTIATYLVLYRSVFWHHSFASMVASQVLGVVGLVTIALAPSTAWLALGLALLAQLVGFNYFSSLYYSTTGSRDEDRGAASGMHEATLAMGQAFGSILGGWTGLTWGARSPYVLAAGAIVVILGVQTVWYRSYVRPRG